uniref:Putative secreted peptide n=1 Tax=Anopheles braziliensis TaxID=58242 RepID=A0A2M3ZN50_9DIPT
MLRQTMLAPGRYRNPLHLPLLLLLLLSSPGTRWQAMGIPITHCTPCRIFQEVPHPWGRCVRASREPGKSTQHTHARTHARLGLEHTK